MAHVFISYSSQHRNLTEDLAEFLEDHGLDVWWDRELMARGPFDQQIGEQLRTAGCVLVVWTDGALASEWVKIEAEYALKHDKLVNVRADDIAPSRLPAPFCNIDAHKVVAERDRILGDVLAVREGRLLLEDKREKLPPPGERTPSMLLQAKYRLVPFTGGKAVLDDLVDWALSRGDYAAPRRRGAGRLIHGPGGLGKTRLLIEVAEVLRAEGWSAGFLSRPSADDDFAKKKRRQDALGHFIRGARDKGLFLVMDYAEGREAEINFLATAIRLRPEDDHRPIRLVLLSRSAGDWWKPLSGNPSIAALFNTGMAGLDVRLIGGASTPETRLEQFVAAARAFAQPMAQDGYLHDGAAPDIARLEVVAANSGSGPGDGYDRPLAVAMEALLYVAKQAPATSEAGVDILLGRVLEMEREHWSKLLGPPKTTTVDSNPDRAMQRAVAQVTGVQGVDTRRSAEDLFMADGRYPLRRGNRDSIETLANNMLKVYGRGIETFAPLEPDLIGEHHFARTADQELIDGTVAWIVTEPESTRDKRYYDLLSVLQRATATVHGATVQQQALGWIDYLLKTHLRIIAAQLIRVIQDTPGSALTSLAAIIPALDTAELAALDDAMPDKSSLLADIALSVAERRADNARNHQPVPGEAWDDERWLSDLARCLVVLGGRLSETGHLEEALVTTAEAVNHYRVLARARPDKHFPNLAAALNNVSGVLSRMGQRQAALNAIQEAVDAYRIAADLRPDVYLSDLAASLTNQGAMLADINQLNKALAATAEAVEIRRILVENDRKIHLAGLAGSLNNLGGDLYNLQQVQAALEVTTEAVGAFSELADASPDTYLPDLATCLSTHGSMLSALNRHEEALAATRRAVDIHRKLAHARPDVFLKDLAGSLNNIGGDLLVAGQAQEAVAVTLEAVDVYRTLAATRPTAYLPDVAMSLTNLAIRQLRLGKPKMALRAATEAESIRRRLAEVMPDIVLPDLATSLFVVARSHEAMDRHALALTSVTEALTILVPFVERQPKVHGGRARAYAADLERYSRMAGRRADAVLLMRVFTALSTGS